MTFGKIIPCVTALVLSTLAVRGATVLIVDITTASAVTVTTINNNAENAESFTTGLDGVTLWGFFTDSVTVNEGMTGDFKATGSFETYNSITADNWSTGFDNLDLNFYVDPGDQNQNFVTTAAPFTGTGTFDLSALSVLPSSGATGSVYSGWSQTPGVLLGEYIVVPEPAPFACAALASGILFLFWARRSRYRKI